MKLTADHEKGRVVVEVPFGGPDSTMVFTLGITEVSSMASFVDREFYFREDLMQELNRMVENGDFDKTLLADETLIEAILDDYCENRHDHGDGNSTDDVWPWSESLRDAMMKHHQEIKKYRVAKPSLDALATVI